MRKAIIEIKNHEKKDYKCETLLPFVSKCSFQKEKKFLKVFKTSGNHESFEFEDIAGETRIKTVDSKIGFAMNWDELLPPKGW